MSAYPPCRCEAPVPQMTTDTTALGRYCAICGGPIPYSTTAVFKPIPEPVTTLHPSRPTPPSTQGEP